MTFDFQSKGMMNVKHLRYKRLWIAIGCLMLLGVVVASLISVPPTLKAFMLQDKVLHTLVYASLMAWFTQIYRHDLTRLMLAIGLVLLGVCIEFAQSMVPARNFDVMDMIANTSGVILAWALAYTWVGNTLAWLEDLFCRTVLRV